MKKLPVKQALEFAAKTMWNNAATILLGTLFWLVALIVSVAGVLLVGGIIAIFGFASSKINPLSSVTAQLISNAGVSTSASAAQISLFVLVGIVTLLALLFVFNALRLGFIKFLMQFDEHHSGSINTMFSCFNGITIRYTIAALLRFAAVFVGLMCFIIPGIYLWIKFRFYTYSILDRNIGSVQSLQNSYRITKDFFLTLFITVLLIGLFNSLINSFVITIFITAPFIGLVNIYLYRFLRDENKQSLISAND